MIVMHVLRRVSNVILINAVNVIFRQKTKMDTGNWLTRRKIRGYIIFSHRLMNIFQAWWNLYTNIKRILISKNGHGNERRLVAVISFSSYFARFLYLFFGFCCIYLWPAYMTSKIFSEWLSRHQNISDIAVGRPG